MTYEGAVNAVLDPFRNILRVKRVQRRRRSRAHAFSFVYYCACFSILLWDTIVLFPTEYRLIWKASLSPIKILCASPRRRFS